MNAKRFQEIFLLAAVLVITLLFFRMIKSFVMTILLAAIFSGLATPLYRRFLGWMGGRKSLSSLCTLLTLFLLVVIPLGAFIGVVTAQAVRVTESVVPTVQRIINEPDVLSNWLTGLPFQEEIEPYRDQIITKAGEIAGTLGSWVFRSLQSGTGWTVGFVFQLFILVYTMFFFLTDGRTLLRKVFYYLPLSHEDEVRMGDKFVSVSRATLKGTMVIGAVQGTLAGIGFAFAGIDQAIFWGTVMTVLSIIPGVGTALVWVPAVIALVLGGQTVAGIVLGLYCAVVVGAVDNFLRPLLVGKDTQMHELLILFGTMGGIFMFGVVGFIIGPIISAMFVAIWDIYGIVFQPYLPAVGGTEEESAS